jgi:L-alanine-DL-glutamate epimerase-like enolase superfamily enzyme
MNTTKRQRTLNIHTETWTFQQPFRIANRSYVDKTFIIVELSEGPHTGRGEAWHLYYAGETQDSVINGIESLAGDIEAGLSREQLQSRLPAGGARNALDLALWDLECQQQQKSIFDLTGIAPQPLTTAYTLGLEDTPEDLGERAKQTSQYPLLKIKLDSDRPVERMAAVRAARPDATLIIDANQAWDIELLKSIAPQLAELNVAMVEQPLPRGKDEALEHYRAPFPLAADESCLDRSELDTVAKRYQMVNIKLDKTGGLTEALALAKAARERGLELMVGNMGGTSLCIAPAFVVGQLCRFVDLDGPLLLKYDRSPAMVYEQASISQPERGCWGDQWRSMGSESLIPIASSN